MKESIPDMPLDEDGFGAWLLSSTGQSRFYGDGIILNVHLIASLFMPCKYTYYVVSIIVCDVLLTILIAYLV